MKEQGLKEFRKLTDRSNSESQRTILASDVMRIVPDRLFLNIRFAMPTIGLGNGYPRLWRFFT